MNDHVLPDTSAQLGHAVFHLMEELSTIINDPHSTADDVYTARARLKGVQSEIVDGYIHDPELAEYEGGLRSAMMTHLNMCNAAGDPVTLTGPRSPEAIRSLRAHAEAIRAGQDQLRDLEPSVRDLVADVYLAHARLSEALRTCGEPPLLVLQGLQVRGRPTTSPWTSDRDIDWSARGKLHWELSTIVGSHDDDHPDGEAAREILEHLRDCIPRLTDDEVRGYLNGLIEEIDTFAWHGLSA